MYRAAVLENEDSQITFLLSNAQIELLHVILQTRCTHHDHLRPIIMENRVSLHLPKKIYIVYIILFIYPNAMFYIVKPHTIMIHQGSLSYAMKATFSIMSPYYITNAKLDLLFSKTLFHEMSIQEYCLFYIIP